MAEHKQDPLDVPMDQVITKDGAIHPKGSEPATESSRIDGSHTQDTADPAEWLPEDPEEQNDLA